MTRALTIKLLLFFAVAFSLSALPGPLSSNFFLPHVNATTLTTPEKWFPAGPQFDYWRPTIFLSEATEFTNLQSPSSQIDLTDWPLTPPVVTSICGQAAFFCTSKTNDTGYFELEFNQAANFWGANCNEGNPLAGGANPCLDFRQGVAHLIDKGTFVSAEPAIQGESCAIDNPEPCSSVYQGHSYTAPNPCSFDPLFPQTNPTRCVVGATGGTSYNCKIGASCPTGTGTPIAGPFTWQPAIGSADFCAAATHFARAFNTILGNPAAPANVRLDPATCELLPPNSTVIDASGNVWKAAIPGWTAPNIFARIDDQPRLDLGRSIGEEECALFTGVFSLTTGGCTQSGATATILSEVEGTITSFPGFTTDPSKAQVTWWQYTAGFGAVFPMDSSLFSGYYSQFTDSYCTTFTTGCPRGAGGTPNVNQPLAQANGGPCANAATPSFGPSDYQFVCNPSFDGASKAMEFSSCVGNPSGDVDTQVGSANATLVNCTGTSARTGISAAYVASDVYGRNVLTLPIFAKQNIFGYLSNWQRSVSHLDSGFEAGFTAFNSYSPNPESATEPTPTLTVRQGFKQTSRSLNPYIATTVWDFFIDGFRNAGTAVYDTMFQENPANPGQLIEWMTNNPNGPTIINCTIGAGGVSTCPGASNPASNPIPTFTTNIIRMDLRSDVFWQDANIHPSSGFVSAWDVKFTYTTMLANGAFQSSDVAPMQCTQPNCVDGIQVTTPRELEIRVSNFGVFSLAGFGGVTIVPGRLWSTCSAATWDSGIAAANVPDSCMSLDPAKAGPGFDPLKAGILIGSGGWQCANANGFTPAGFTSPPAIGTGCAHDASGLPFNAQNPPVGGTYTLQRFGYGTGAPGAAPPNRIYFRAESKTAQWIWSGNTGDPLHDSNNKGIVQRCQNASLAPFGAIPDPTLGFPNGCAHWQQGIGAPGGHSLVGSFQIGTVQLLFQYKWTPTTNGVGSDWTSTYGTPPDGIASFPPVLYEGSFVQAGVTYNNVLTPATIATAHCTSAYNATTPAAGYDC